MSTLPLALDSYLVDWLDLLLRWLHVIAAIAWIGASFYFVLLDQSLRPPADTEDTDAGVAGELWEVHGGGFYHVQKYRVAPPALPEHLAWFKWEAYTTWLSGFLRSWWFSTTDAGGTLVDPSVADLDPWLAVVLSVGLLVAAWLAYDVLCRLLGRDERGSPSRLRSSPSSPLTAPASCSPPAPPSSRSARCWARSWPRTCSS